MFVSGVVCVLVGMCEWYAYVCGNVCECYVCVCWWVSLRVVCVCVCVCVCVGGHVCQWCVCVCVGEYVCE